MLRPALNLGDSDMHKLQKSHHRTLYHLEPKKGKLLQKPRKLAPNSPPKLNVVFLLQMTPGCSVRRSTTAFSAGLKPGPAKKFSSSVPSAFGDSTMKVSCLLFKKINFSFVKEEYVAQR